MNENIRKSLHGFIVILIILLAFPVYADNKITFYHSDAVGTPLAMSNIAGEKIWEATYLPFGEEFLLNEIDVLNNRRFVGKEKDGESGLHYFGARYLVLRDAHVIIHFSSTVKRGDVAALVHYQPIPPLSRQPALA